MNKVQALEGSYSFFKDPEAALASYNEHGFHVEKNVLDPEYCDLLVRHGLELSLAKKGDFKPFMMPHRENPIYIDALKNKKIVEIMAKLVDGVPMAVQSQFFYCVPGTRGFSLHQDNFFVQAPYGNFVSAWIALVDTSPANGGLTVYPETHKAGELPVRKLQIEWDGKQDPNANNEETVVPEKYSIENLTIPKGSVLFIHGHVVHGSNPNSSDKNRYVLLNTYIKEGVDFRKGNYAQREPMAVM